MKNPIIKKQIVPYITFFERQNKDLSSFQVVIKNVYYGKFKTLDEAIVRRDQIIQLAPTRGIKNTNGSDPNTRLPKKSLGRPRNHYLNGPAFHQEMCKSLTNGNLTNDSIKMFMLLVNKMSTKFSWKNPDDKQDCFSQAYHDFVKYHRNYNPNYKNAFAYFTQIAKNAFAKAFRTLHNKEIKTVSIDEFINII